MSELQKQKFEAEDGAGSFEMSENSFSIQNDDGAGKAGGVTDLANLSKNVVIFDCDQLEPVLERVKLDGDEYGTGNRRLDKKDSAAGASMEIFRSLECLPMECREALK